jgi:hypothetical protein
MWGPYIVGIKSKKRFAHADFESVTNGSIRGALATVINCHN